MAAPRKKGNVGNYDAAVRFFTKITQDMEDKRRAMNPPYLDTLNELTKTLGQVQHKQIEMSKEWASLKKAPVIDLTTISKSTQNINNIFAQTNLAIDSLSQAHKSWFEQEKLIKDTISPFEQLNIAAKRSLLDTSMQLTVTGDTLADLDFDLLNNQFDLPRSSISAVEKALLDTTASYYALTESIEDLSNLVKMPSFVLPGATFSLYTASLALKALDLSGQPVSVKPEETAAALPMKYVDQLDIVGLLKLVNPDLVTLYLGAKEALRSNNPDRIRHALSSLRELWNHVVRAIAPDKQVLAWIAARGNADDLRHNKRPTRRAKVKYLSRYIDSPPMVDFVDQYATMSIRLHKLFGRIHELEPGLTEAQLFAILWQTEFEIMLLIRTWLTTDRP